MTRYFKTFDDAYAYIERMMDKFDHYTTAVIGDEIQVVMF